jgi:hypothetical protein
MKQLTLFPLPPPLMPFGIHQGRLLTDVPTSYLGWLIGQPGLRASLAMDVRAELDRREAETAPRVYVPEAEPRVVHGVALDGYQSALLAAAEESGVLRLTADVPASSPVPAVWREVCEGRGIPCRVEEVGVREVDRDELVGAA